MLKEHRTRIGQVALLLALVFLLTALGRGGFWWAAVAIFSGLALWGIGPSEDSSGS